MSQTYIFSDWESDIFNVDHEIASLLPPPSPECIEKLEESILEHGCLDPIVVEEETNTIIDGYHRHSLCKKHNLPLPYLYMSFSSRDDLKLFAIKMQLSRRNLGPSMFSVARAQYVALAKSIGKSEKDIAASLNTTTRTVRFDAACSRALASFPADVQEAIVASPDRNRAAILRLFALDDEQKNLAFASIREHGNVARAIRELSEHEDSDHTPNQTTPRANDKPTAPASKASATAARKPTQNETRRRFAPDEEKLKRLEAKLGSAAASAVTKRLVECANPALDALDSLNNTQLELVSELVAHRDVESVGEAIAIVRESQRKELDTQALLDKLLDLLDRAEAIANEIAKARGTKRSVLSQFSGHIHAAREKAASL